MQDIRKHKCRPAKMAEQNIFFGLIHCKDYGKSMVLSRARTMDSVKNNFQCSTYRKRGKETCSVHYIREAQLAAILLDDLRRVTHFARQHELLFARHITQKNSAEILNLFIERVDVREREEKWSHTAPQKINIYYRDIGLLDRVTEQQEEQETPGDSPEVA